MAKASTSVDQDQFHCPVCLDPLNNPVTTTCGHNFCQVCINRFWDEEDQRKVYSCPQCRETFTPRPPLRRNNLLAEMVEKLKKTEVQAASSAHCYAEPGDVECDFCIGRKHKAVNACLVCQAFCCEDHLKHHDQSPILKKHKLAEACAELQQISSQQAKQKKSDCYPDQSCSFYLCMMDEQKFHDTGINKQSSPSLCVTPESEDSPSIAVNQDLLPDGVMKSLSDVKTQLGEICEEEFNKILPQDFCYLTLDPNTAHRQLILSDENRAATHSKTEQRYTYHPERFDSKTQVLCKESVCGRCYWEVEWSGNVSISVSYKEISRTGECNKCCFGYNKQSWSLQCSRSSVSFWHNNIKTKLQGPPSSRIGVYVDHSAGTLSFYSVSDTMRLLHRVHTTFTQPLYAGFRIWYNSAVRLCDPKLNVGKSDSKN